MAMSWRTRSIVTTDRTDTIADGVAGRFPIPAVLRDLLAVADHVPLVEEEASLRACECSIGRPPSSWSLRPPSASRRSWKTPCVTAASASPQ